MLQPLILFYFINTILSQYEHHNDLKFYTGPESFGTVTDMMNKFAFSAFIVAAIYTVIMSFTLKPVHRTFHHIVFIIHSICVSFYAAAIAGLTLIKNDDKHPLIFHHDEYLIHGIVQVVILPMVTHIINVTAGVFTSQGRFIVLSTAVSGVFGMFPVYLPHYWATYTMSLLSGLTIIPYLYGLLYLWNCNVIAAPQRVRNKVKLVISVQLLAIVIVSVMGALSIFVETSADFENSIYIIYDLLVFGFVPLLLVSDPAVVKDVYCREDFIRTTNILSSDRATYESADIV